MKAGNDLLFHFLLATKDAIRPSVARIASVSGPAFELTLDPWTINFRGSMYAESLYVSTTKARVDGTCLGAYWLGDTDPAAVLHSFYKREAQGKKMLLQSTSKPLVIAPSAIIHDVLNWERLLRWHNDGVVPLTYADWLNDHNLGEREDAVRRKYEEWIPEDTNPVLRRR